MKGGTWKFDGYDRDNFTLGDEDAEIRGTWSFHSDTSPSTKPDSGEGSNAANKDTNNDAIAADSDAGSKAGSDNSSSKKLAQTDDVLNGITVAATVIMFAFACLSAVVGAIFLLRNDHFVS